MTKKLTEQEVNERDQSSASYCYFKPIAGEQYKSHRAKRKHYCERCNTVSEIAPEYFWRGRGCQNCSSMKGQNQGFTASKVVEKDQSARFFSVYPPDRNQVYVNQYTKRKHTCSDCGYKGEMTPKSFWMDRGCPICGAKRGSKNKIKNASTFALEKDKEAVAYSSYPPITEYTGVDNLRKHKCKDCGFIGEMKPDNFWHNGRGCPECGAKKASLNKRLNNKERAPERDRKSPHYDTYPPISEYTGSFEHREHQCIDCGYKGLMIPNNYWRGKGCPVCADSGFDKEAPAIMYYLKVRASSNLFLYKIGITNRTVTERFNLVDLEKIETIKTWSFDKGRDAFLEEKMIKDKFKHAQYVLAQT